MLLPAQSDDEVGSSKPPAKPKTKAPAKPKAAAGPKKAPAPKKISVVKKAAAGTAMRNFTIVL